jgi:hypothetical protein
MIAWLMLVAALITAPEAPRIFAPGVISTAALAESGGAFSPDGNEFYFTARSATTTSRPVAAICISRRVNGRWTKPAVASFSGVYWDASVAMSPDGSRLYFASTRHNEPARRDTDIWFVERTATGWTEARDAGPHVNTAGEEHSPSVAADGTLYFVSSRPGGKGASDIYRAQWVDGSFAEPVNVEEVNSDAAELSPFITPDQRVLLFAAIGRPDMRLAGGRHYARSDLYVSFFRDGHWTPPEQFPEPINTVASESGPLLSPDGKQMYFTSERQPFFVPVRKGLTFDALEHARASVENGLANIYVVATPPEISHRK